MNGGNMSSLLMIVAMLVVMFFFFIRPQQKRMKELKNFRQALEKGSKVVTTGGIHGKVVELRENNTVLVDSGGTKIIVDRESLNPGFEPAQK